MKTLLSKDGTKIAYDKVGAGPVIIIVLGALNSRKSGASLAKLLAPHFTVINYDRRGRGNSGDTLPYAPEREIDDLVALINEVGEPVYLYGHSSGGALALKATLAIPEKVKKLAVYEVPYVVSKEEVKAAKEYQQHLTTLLDKGDRDAAVTLFISHVGVSEKQIAAIKRLPMWKGLVAMAPTLAYDSAVLGEGHSLNNADFKDIGTKSLVMHGEKGAPAMRDVAQVISEGMVNAKLLTVEGQDHGFSPKVMAPILTEFFNK